MGNNLAKSLAAAAFALTAATLALPAAAATRSLPATPTTIAVYAGVLHRINPSMPSWQRNDLAKRVLVNAERWRIDANMLVAIVTVESEWHTRAVSRAGAIGLGQLMPGTAALLGVDPRDPIQNLNGAARYLSGLVARFGSGNACTLAIAAYNAGPEAVTQYGGIPPFDETQRYVVKVQRAWLSLQQSVHLPEYLADEPGAHGIDVDYWLDGTEH
jgi:soluble lytic murein transglycosylase-like protein